jgi:CelD/BcsL family acetyltransferase involved in cellulose biosynthesis
MRSYYVNLDKVRRNNYDYLALIGSKKRYQIRRSMKEYEKMGQIRLNIAENAEDAIEIFIELSQLHQKTWTDRGFPGSFSNEYFDRFHKNLITGRFEYGEIQLMKVTAGGHTLGCLYGFIYKGQFLGTLSGFNYLPGYLYSPGLICHYFAIVHYARMGLSCYDFLEGDDDYKRSLSTDYNKMQNITVQKSNLKFKAEKIMLQLHGLYKMCGMKFRRPIDENEIV